MRSGMWKCSLPPAHIRRGSATGGRKATAWRVAVGAQVTGGDRARENWILMAAQHGYLPAIQLLEAQPQGQ